MIFPHAQQPLALHSAQFGRQRAAIHPQIIRQLLAVKGNIKLLPAPAGRLIGEIGLEPSADGFCRNMEHAPGKDQILLRRH